MLSETKSRLDGKTFLQTLFFFLLLTQICFPQVNWTKYPGNPILTGGPSGSWNRNLVEASVLYNADSSRFEMWFAATSGVFPYRIGYAKSTDGISWEMRLDPVLNPTSGTWDQYSIQYPFVIRENGQYKMWYSSSPQSDYNQCKIGYATSLDGIEWTKDTLHNPIFGPGTDSWEAGGVMACYVMPVSGGYKIWYTGFTTALANGNLYIGYATSEDGISWQRDTINNPVLEPGVAGGWEGKWVWYPEVLFKNELYYMWYAGSNIGFWDLIEVGLATSADGVEWTKHPQNPVLSPSPGMWDGARVECSSIKLIGDSLWMWYHGMGSFWQFGLAKSRLEPVSVEQGTTLPTKFSLAQNYPNPFNPNTKIKFSVPYSSNVIIKVFDILGNEIATLINEEKSVGTYELTWNATSLPSGVYFYQLKAGDFIQTKKMLLLK